MKSKKVELEQMRSVMLENVRTIVLSKLLQLRVNNRLIREGYLKKPEYSNVETVTLEIVNLPQSCERLSYDLAAQFPEFNHKLVRLMVHEALKLPADQLAEEAYRAYYKIVETQYYEIMYEEREIRAWLEQTYGHVSEGHIPLEDLKRAAWRELKTLRDWKYEPLVKLFCEAMQTLREKGKYKFYTSAKECLFYFFGLTWELGTMKWLLESLNLKSNDEEIEEFFKSLPANMRWINEWAYDEQKLTQKYREIEQLHHEAHHQHVEAFKALERFAIALINKGLNEQQILEELEKERPKILDKDALRAAFLMAKEKAHEFLVKMEVKKDE